MIKRLDRLENNQLGIVKSIDTADGLRFRLESLGLRPGVTVRKVSDVGPVVVAVGNSQVALGKGMAEHVSVETKKCMVLVFGNPNVGKSVVDCYNANPASMGEALWLLGAIEVPAGGSRRAVLGDMLELGPDSERLHEAVGRRVPPSVSLYVAGAFSAATARGAEAAGVDAARIRRFEDVDAMAAAVLADTKPGDLVLVKGSRGMRLERVVEALAPGRAGSAAPLAAAGRD